MIKYCLHPGYVISQNDGDRHFIGAARLADLYRVHLSECVVDDEWHRWNMSGLVCLYPSASGTYILGPEPLPRP